MPLISMARARRAAPLHLRHARVLDWATRVLRIRMLIGAVATVAAVAACDPNAALKVPEPDNITGANINSAAALPALRNGTLSSFQIAYSGAADGGNFGHEGHVGITGLFVDELQDQETFSSRIQIDTRLASTGNQSLNALFIDISTARAFADKANSKYILFAPNDPGQSLMLSLGGYAYTILAENYCNGVPQSTLNDNGSITYGVPMSREQLLTIAVQHFDSAITIANANSDANMLGLAQIGLGRALLDSNDDADAAAAVAAVPTSYQYVIGASTNSAVENNGIWNYTINSESFGMSDTEGHNGLNFVSAHDPRIPFIDTHGPGVRAAAGDFVMQQLYPDQSSSIPLATGVEAQLIIAEHQLRTGGPAGGFLATLNALRTTVPGLAPIALAAPTMTVAVDTLFRERAFWMYLTAHRLGDLRRMVRQYGFDANTVFPIGNTVYLSPFNSDVTLPVPAEEDANPNFHGCTDRNA